jgi:hypothetical protein
MSVRTMSPLPTGSQVRLRFRLPGAKREIEAEAAVTWCDHRIGMGLEFQRLEAADHGSVAEFVDGHFFAPEL